MATITENFESVVAELIGSAATDKARAFAIKVTDQARARGAEWLKANEFQLCISMPASQQVMMPVADNRLYIITQFQLALNK